MIGCRGLRLLYYSAQESEQLQCTTSEPIASVPTETRSLFDSRLLSVRMAATDQVARLCLRREVVSRSSLPRLAITSLFACNQLHLPIVPGTELEKRC